MSDDVQGSASIICPVCDHDEMVIHAGKRHMIRCVKCNTKTTTDAALKIGGQIISPVYVKKEKQQAHENWQTLAFRVPAQVKQNVKECIQAFIEWQGPALTYVNAKGKRKPVTNIAGKFLEYAAESLRQELGVPLYDLDEGERPKVFIKRDGEVVAKSKESD